VVSVLNAADGVLSLSFISDFGMSTLPS
jgi:hypothetical protein